MLWSKTQTAHPIAVAVDIYKLTVGSEGVGTHEIIVGKDIFGVIFPRFLLIFRQGAIYISVIFRMAHHIIQKTDLFDGSGAAAADGQMGCIMKVYRE